MTRPYPKTWLTHLDVMLKTFQPVKTSTSSVLTKHTDTVRLHQFKKKKHTPTEVLQHGRLRGKVCGNRGPTFLPNSSKRTANDLLGSVCVCWVQQVWIWIWIWICGDGVQLMVRCQNTKTNKKKKNSIRQPRGNERLPLGETYECVFWTLFFVVSSLTKVFGGSFDWLVCC